MPVDRNLYPLGWKDFSAEIRFQRARGRCECSGQCGLHSGYPTKKRCTEQHGKKAHYAKGLVRLTVAHLCSCDPICMNPNHVIAACQRCHLRIDRFRHAKNRIATQRARTTRQDAPGQAAALQALPPYPNQQE
jgi:hypothetical protein